MRKLEIDLDAIAANLRTMRAGLRPGPNGAPKVMCVVKANAYGHGMVEVARKLASAGADYFGVADVTEALALRAAGIETPILAWLHSPDERFTAAVAAQIEIGVSTFAQLEALATAALAAGVAGGVHLKIDTGLGRNGATAAEWQALVERAAELEGAGALRVAGIFSHLSCTSEADDLQQIAAFEVAVAQARTAGLTPELRHLTASDGTLRYPQAHYDMVRIGVALYGLSPFAEHAAAEFGLRPAMRATARVVQVKSVPAGQGVSYGFEYRTGPESRLALVPVGYAEGLPRLAGGKARVAVGGQLFTIAGRIAMDQFVLDVGGAPVRVGDEVVLFGDPATGVPSADQLAQVAQTINYEIVTRMGGRFERVYFSQTDAPGNPLLLAEVEVADADAMASLGHQLAADLAAGDLLVLTGALGAGKTTLTRAIGEALGCTTAVSSPTFVIARTHQRAAGAPPLVHVDAYRLGSPAELDDLDIDYPGSVTIVEWGRGMCDGLVESWRDIEIERDQTGASETRRVRIWGYGPRWSAA